MKEETSQEHLRKQEQEQSKINFCKIGTRVETMPKFFRYKGVNGGQN